MYTHDRACACTGRTPLCLTLILGANIINCKSQNLENVGLAGLHINVHVKQNIASSILYLHLYIL